MPFVATWIDLKMDLMLIILSKVSQKEKDKYHMISLLCGSLNTTQMNLSTKQKLTHRHREPPLWLPRVRAERGGKD